MHVIVVDGLFLYFCFDSVKLFKKNTHTRSCGPRCASTAKAIPKDKAIKRFTVRNIVDASALRDIKESSAYENYNLPKLYIKMYYSIEAAVHQRIVRVRSNEDRKNRLPPPRPKFKQN